MTLFFCSGIAVADKLVVLPDGCMSQKWQANILDSKQSSGNVLIGNITGLSKAGKLPNERDGHWAHA